MNRPFGNPIWLALVIAAMGASSFAPESVAAATCGDYVIHAQRSSASPGLVPGGGLLSGPLGPSFAESAASLGAQNAARPVAPSCHGPQCQRDLPTPTAPAPMTSLSSADVAFWSSLGDAAANPTRADWIDAASAEPRAGFRPSIDHPPRLAS